MEYSKWNIVDLHIHSAFSNKVKKNDYKGPKYSAIQLLEKLEEYIANESMIFSITDHNSIDVDLYTDIFKEIKTERFRDKFACIIGVEIDVIDLEIYENTDEDGDSRFHCLVFFSENDPLVIKKAIDELFDNKVEKDRNVDYPDINKIFSTLKRNEIKDIILIPHYHNKSQGIPSNKIDDKILNTLCFNAYEDANNINGIRNSLRFYLDNRYNDFPFVVFSDNHNLSIYPLNNNGNDHNKCRMLTNINFPFNSIKTSFQEPRLRISIEGVAEMRSHLHRKYLQQAKLPNVTVNFSPYQNTIVGRFGSGKSLLLERIKYGEYKLKNNDKYSDFYNDQGFKLTYDDNQYDSLEELKAANKNIKVYTHEQIEKYYYKNELSKDDATELFKKINLDYSFEENPKFDFKESDFLKAYEELKNCMNKTDSISNINYEYAFSKCEYLSIDENVDEMDLQDIIEKLKVLKDSIKTMNDWSIDDISIFTKEELNFISLFFEMLNSKSLQMELLRESDFVEQIREAFTKYHQTFIKNDNITKLNNFNNWLDEYIKCLETFTTLSCDFENVLNEKEFKLLNKPNSYPIDGEYIIESRYDVDDEQFVSPIDHIFKSPSRKDSLFTSTIYSLFNSSESLILNNIKYENKVASYVEKMKKLFVDDYLRFDILHNNESILKKSVGEKSSLFIDLFFHMIYKDYSSEKDILLIMDQPEDNIDNNNILEHISKIIKNLKIECDSFQSIIVTHNANVGITADSENIIVASENLSSSQKTFDYKEGCIENPDFIAKVCDILEGGKDAIKRRSQKYGINVIKDIHVTEEKTDEV